MRPDPAGTSVARGGRRAARAGARWWCTIGGGPWRPADMDEPEQEGPREAVAGPAGGGDGPLLPRWAWALLALLAALAIVFLFLRVPNPAPPPLDPVLP